MAQEELNAADAEKITGIAILSFIRWPSACILDIEIFQPDVRYLIFSYSSLITLLFYFFVKNALTVIRVRCLILCRVDDFKTRSEKFIEIENVSMFRCLQRR